MFSNVLKNSENSIFVGDSSKKSKNEQHFSLSQNLIVFCVYGTAPVHFARRDVLFQLRPSRIRGLVQTYRRAMDALLQGRAARHGHLCRRSPEQPRPARERQRRHHRAEFARMARRRYRHPTGS